MAIAVCTLFSTCMILVLFMAVTKAHVETNVCNKASKKPSGACAQKLAELYLASKHTPVERLGEAFNPL